MTLCFQNSQGDLQDISQNNLSNFQKVVSGPKFYSIVLIKKIKLPPCRQSCDRQFCPCTQIALILELDDRAGE